MNYSCVFFDLDGTLLNTLDDLYNSVNFALKQEGLPERSKDDVRHFTGQGVGLLIARSVPAGTSEDVEARVLEQFKRHYAIHNADVTAPYPGALAALKQLKEAGLTLGVASNKLDSAVVPLVKNYFGDLIHQAIGEREGMQRKPHPEMLTTLCSELGADKASSVYVGDSNIDIQTAAEFGIPCISCSWGFRSIEELKEAGAMVIVDSWDELVELILG